MNINLLTYLLLPITRTTGDSKQFIERINFTVTISIILHLTFSIYYISNLL